MSSSLNALSVIPFFEFINCATETLLQRHIASHLSSTAVVTEDLKYPECLFALQADVQSLAGASPATAGGDTGSCPPHVFPVLAASLAFLRRIEVALETSVFEKLVGEVLSFVSFRFIVVIFNAGFRFCRRHVGT
jgi:hypothetical protein